MDNIISNPFLIIPIIAVIIFIIFTTKEIYEISGEINNVHKEAQKYKSELKKEDEPPKYLKNELNHLNTLYNAKEGYIYKLLLKRFVPNEMSYKRYEYCLINCREYFDTNMELANESYGLAIEEEYLFKAKEITKGIEKLMIELIKYDDDKENDNIILKELENVIEDVKEYQK